MRPTTQALLTEIQNLPLLSKLGQPHSLPHRSAGSWKEALEFCNSETWNALQLMTKNRHAGIVNQLNWHRCQEWNAICAAVRPEIAKLSTTNLERIHHTLAISEELKATLSWDMLGILVEREFDDVAKPAFYLPILFPVYQAGHLPCGWTGPKLDTYWSASSAPLPPGEILIY